ncbi:multidrug resistance-associated protein 4-like [Neophocaena asiaeorientalis asiaeorientalis]|uniref:Multidrug resistance-associated protein 4-like n=1 Tax=Neophocaena asiaeorientalis asiaeorientalis TaxID=1706337 RepID=A0A341CAR2_NEOAA|nr:multidrug resistance-associated protein 4-like [Neophocaena asiaeorientalis asiaeorientalis]
MYEQRPPSRKEPSASGTSEHIGKTPRGCAGGRQDGVQVHMEGDLQRDLYTCPKGPKTETISVHLWGAPPLPAPDPKRSRKAAWLGVDADGTAAGAPLQVPTERRRPGLQTPRQRRQDAAGVPGGAAEPAAGREPLLPPVLVSAPPELRHPANAGPCRTPPAPFRGQSVGRGERFPPPLEPSHASGVFRFAPLRAGRAGADPGRETRRPGGWGAGSASLAASRPANLQCQRAGGGEAETRSCPGGVITQREEGLQSLHPTVSRLPPCRSPVLCHLIPEGLGMAFLSVFLTFPLLDEISQCNPQLPSDGKTVVDVQDFTAFWDESSLLSAVLGELPPSQGLVSVHGRIAKRIFLEDGDLTVIGDRGTTLSGGQKARVNLARAVYQDADIYLLDDPLSAVDAEVSRHLFELCVRQALHEKIAILVTRQSQYLKAASQILVLKDGKIVQKGTYTTFPKSGVDFEDILLKKENEETEPSPVPGSPALRNRTFSESSVWSQQSSRPSLQDAAPEDQDTEHIQVTLPLESYSEGRVHFKTYMNYFTAGAHWLTIIFLLLVNIAAQVAYVLQDWWLSYWANEQSALNVTVNGQGNVTEKLDLYRYLGIYSVLTVGTVLFGITRSLLIFCVLVNSSQIWHNKMLESILRAPVLFFDRNPIGRILNRFSKDVGRMDDLLPLTFLDFIQTFLLVIGVAGVMVAVIPWTVTLLVPLGIIFFVLRQYFLETSGDVKRLECAARSLVFSHLAFSFRGLWTIRANSAEQKFQEVFDAHQDLHSDDFSRVIEYTDLEKEAPWKYFFRLPPPAWPHEGKIFFQNINLRLALWEEQELEKVPSSLPFLDCQNLKVKLPSTGS